MNKVILLGRLTKDPEIRYSNTTNTIVAQFTLAVNRKYVKQGEERQTDFFNIVAWNNQAEAASKYLTKGMQVIIIGRLQNRSWEDNQNVKHYITEVICDEIEFVESKKKQTTDENILNSSTPISNDTEDVTEEIISGDDLPF